MGVVDVPFGRHLGFVFVIRNISFNRFIAFENNRSMFESQITSAIICRLHTKNGVEKVRLLLDLENAKQAFLEMVAQNCSTSPGEISRRNL